MQCKGRRSDVPVGVPYALLWRPSKASFYLSTLESTVCEPFLPAHWGIIFPISEAPDDLKRPFFSTRYRSSREALLLVQILRMDSLSSKASPIGVVAAVVDPDKAIRISRFFSYPKQVLYLVASFIALVSLCHFISLAYRFAIRFRVYPTTRTPFSLRRFPTAVIDSLRAIAFRWTVPIGSSHTLNLAEVGMTLGYTGVVLSWTFVNSMPFRATSSLCV